MRYLRSWLFLLAVILGLLQTQGAGAADHPIPVVASFTVLADMVREVGGNAVDVVSLVGPNGDPHVFEPSPADAKAISGAKLVFISGLGLEGWMERLIAASGHHGSVVTASAGIKTRTMVDEDAPTPITDPHAWNSLANGKVYVANIAKALAAADPARATTYHANAKAYSQKIDALDAWIRKEFGTIPKSKRRLITSHDAFGYFGDAYGVEFLAPVGFSTDAEASAGGVVKLIEQIRKEGIKALFIENASDPRLVEQIAKETGAKVGPALYPESLSEPGGPAPDYLTMVRYNATTILTELRLN